MKTMQSIIDRLNKKQSDIEFYLDNIDSYSGYYRICITDNTLPVVIPSYYTFGTITEFKQWTKEIYSL